MKSFTIIEVFDVRQRGKPDVKHEIMAMSELCSKCLPPLQLEKDQTCPNWQ
jgi:hypothetical protein